MTLFKESPASLSGTKPQASTNDAQFNETLKRMLNTPPAPHDSGRKARTSGKDQKQKSGGNPAKNNRPEAQ